MIQVANNVTSTTVGNTNQSISLTFDSNGVITAATNAAINISGSNIFANTISNTNIATGAVENYLRANALDFGMRNRIINGAMVIDQRNAGANVTITDTSNLTYTLDRWTAYGSAASKFSVQQNVGSVTPPNGFINYFGATSLSAYSVVSGDSFTIQQAIEGLNVSDLGWGTANAKTVTLSFWVRSSLTGTFGGSLRNSNVTRSYPFTYTISSANTWEYKTVTIAGDTSGTWLTTNGIGIRLCFSIGSGSTFSGTAGAWAGSNFTTATGATSVVGTNGATFYITGVQLEVGSTATSFDYRPYGTELELCLRYYHFLGGDTPYQSINNVAWYADSAAVGFFRHPVPMRAIPSISKSGNWAVLGGGGTVGQTLSVDQLGPKTVQLGFGLGSGGTSGQASTLRVDNDNNFRLTFSAEL